MKLILNDYKVFIKFGLNLTSESNPCATLQCTQYQECEIDRYGIATCQCPPQCPTTLRPVCGSDGHTYDSECDLQRQSCLLHKDIHLKHSGNCGKYELKFFI